MKKISTIIFDLGGVLLDLDQNKTLRAFERLGLNLEDVNEVSPIFNEFEIGKISATEFRQGICNLKKISLTDMQIDEAWNAMLLETNELRFEIIEGLRKRFNIYLLSNTNSIHIDYFKKYIESTFGRDRWVNLFDKQFLSFEIGLRKPHKDIYEFVLNDIGRAADECIFIDDNIANINGAASLGIQTVFAKEPLNQAMLKSIHDTVRKNQ